MSAKSFSIRIFLPDGTADGVKIISKSKWTGRGMIIPRALFAEEKQREELNAPGVYVLIGLPGEDDLSTITIGSADPICDRLEQHDAETDFWSWTMVFTSKKDKLNRAQIGYLEARLLQLAREAKNSHLNNPDNPRLPALTDAEQEEAELFLDHMLSICPLLGLTAFESSEIKRVL